MFCICMMLMIIVIFGCSMACHNQKRKRNEEKTKQPMADNPKKNWIVCVMWKSAKTFHKHIKMLQYSVTHVSTHDEFVCACVFFICTHIRSIFLVYQLGIGLTQWRVHNNFSVLNIIWNDMLWKALKQSLMWSAFVQINICIFMRNILLSYAHFTFSWFLVCHRCCYAATAYAESRNKWTECELWLKQTKGDTSNKEQLFHKALHWIYLGMPIAEWVFLLCSVHRIVW